MAKPVFFKYRGKKIDLEQAVRDTAAHVMECLIDDVGAGNTIEWNEHCDIDIMFDACGDVCGVGDDILPASQFDPTTWPLSGRAGSKQLLTRLQAMARRVILRSRAFHAEDESE
jgi:hypothetical protein